MESYQERVVAERAELSQKLERLRKFLSSGGRAAEEAEQLRLNRQADVMTEYLGILDERIASF